MSELNNPRKWMIDVSERRYSGGLISGSDSQFLSQKIAWTMYYSIILKSDLNGPKDKVKVHHKQLKVHNLWSLLLWMLLRKTEQKIIMLPNLQSKGWIRIHCS